MALTKYKLGDLIEESFRKNSSLEYGMEYVRGISNNKEIAQTKADVDVSVIHKFYIVNPCEFIYNPRTTRMGDKVGLAYNNTTTPLLFSFNNIAFYIKESAREIILPEYLYMYFRRPEFDRYAITNSWGSATELFSFDEMCDISIDLPDIEIQRKYVAIYNALLANQQSYERGLDDLKLVCDGYIEDLRKKYPCEMIGKYIHRGTKNTNNDISLVRGIGKEGFIVPQKDPNESLRNYKILSENSICYAPPLYNVLTGALHLYTDKVKAVCSPIYEVFSCDEINLHAPYLELWLKREEFKRYAAYFALGVRQTFEYQLMEEIEIPIPEIGIQRSIANIYKVYKERQHINAQMKQQLKDICPILIKGSMEEGRKN